MAQELSGVVDKWGAIVAERGFAQVPNYLLLLNNFLSDDNRLAPAELLVLIQLVGAWWEKDKLPFPSISTLAVRSGVSERQVQRAIARLIELKLLARASRRNQGLIASNAYDLTPLVEVLQQVAKAYPNAFPRRQVGIAAEAKKSRARKETKLPSQAPQDEGQA